MLLSCLNGYPQGREDVCQGPESRVPKSIAGCCCKGASDEQTLHIGFTLSLQPNVCESKERLGSRSCGRGGAGTSALFVESYDPELWLSRHPPLIHPGLLPRTTRLK